MPSIISYRKHIDSLRTIELRLPEDAKTHHHLGTELATIDGMTYVCLPDDVALPLNQPAEIVDSIQSPELTAALRATISDASPHVALIRARVTERISAQYSISDEIKLLRTAPSAEFEVYNDYVEDCRQWGRDEKAKLGL